MSTLDEALRLSSRLSVFPCLASKKPACPNGFKNATRNPSEIVDLWRKYPGDLIGYPTGAVNGIDVLDIDIIHGAAIWIDEALDSLPITRIHHTRSGGYHFLFRHADGVKNTASKIAPGVDTRGCGGYAVAWHMAGYKVENPTVIAEWPKWLLSILNPPKIRRPPPEPATLREANTRASLMIDRAYDRVRNAAPGQRHYQLRAAAATLGGLAQFMNKSLDQIAEDLVVLVIQAGGEDRRNAEKTVEWAMTKGLSSPLLKKG